MTAPYLQSYEPEVPRMLPSDISQERQVLSCLSSGQKPAIRCQRSDDSGENRHCHGIRRSLIDRPGSGTIPFKFAVEQHVSIVALRVVTRSRSATN